MAEPPQVKGTMRLVDIAQSIRDAWDVLFAPKPSFYVIHLEREIMELRNVNRKLEGKCDLFQLKLETALAPKPAPVLVKREIPKIPPMESSWEAEVRRHREENERLDREEAAKAQGVVNGISE
jgi:hypothetical protein